MGDSPGTVRVYAVVAQRILTGIFSLQNWYRCYDAPPKSNIPLCLPAQRLSLPDDG